MRIELWIFFAVMFLMYDTYHDNKYSKMMLSYKKYFQIMVIGVGGLIVYYIVTKSPNHLKNVFRCANDYLKYVPIDKNSKDMLTPIFDLTNSNILEKFKNTTPPEKRMMTSGSNIGNKRVVSETKKKYVASQNNWKCADCNNQLTHTFEIDHKISLKNGGDNSVENLTPLCRTCHGNKTSLENM